jgi:hypothetical protein
MVHHPWEPPKPKSRRMATAVAAAAVVAAAVVAMKAKSVRS